MDHHNRSHRCIRILYFIWKIFTCLFTHVMLVTLVVAYCMLGAVTFEHLEKENEILVKLNIAYIRENLTEDLWVYTKDMPVLRQENWTANALIKLKNFENDLVLAIRKSGWDGSEDLGSLQWTFAGALFYSIIVITTIGYGHIAPKTQLGKVSTIFYAILGIPLMLLCLSNIGDIMAHSFRFLYWRVCCYSCTKEEQNRLNSRRRQREREINRNERALREGRILQTSYHMQNMIPPPISVQPLNHQVNHEGQHSVLCNKYVIDKEDGNKGNLDTHIVEHINLNPRISDPRYIYSRQNQMKIRDYYDDYDDNPNEVIKPVPIWLCVFLVVSYIVGGAFLFSNWEQWGFADSAYFCFITLTTIGFGDFVPAQRVTNKNEEMSIVLCSLYLLFGIALLAMSFNLVQEEVITNVKAVAKHLGIIKSDEDIN